MHIQCIIKFQFHNGSIKSKNNARCYFKLPGFNSTMVRLKVNVNVILEPAAIGFNSTMVRLKGFLVPAIVRATLQFQFHNGSIKSLVAKPAPTNVSKPCFNSTMVRLKARKNQQRYYTKPTLYLQGENCLQFQKSSTSSCVKLTEG